MKVHRLGHGGIDLHAPGVVALLFGRHSRPVGRGRHTDHRRIFGHQSQCRCPIAPGRAQSGPAILVDTLVFVDECTRCLHRNVVGLKCQVGIERLVRLGIHPQIVNGLVDVELGGIELFGHDGLPAVFKPVDLVGQGHVTLRRFPIVGTTVTLHQRPVEPARIRQVVGLLAHVPLAYRVGAVATLLQQRTDGHHVLVQHGQVARAAVMLQRHAFAHGAHSRAMAVHPGHQHGARGRAFGRHVEVGETRPLLRQRIEVRRSYFAAKRSHIGEPPVVGHHDNDVGA